MKPVYKKTSLFVVATFFCLLSQGQQDQLIRLALADIGNFEVMSFYSQGEKMPKKFYVFDSTAYWPYYRFYLEGVKANEIKWSRDEHHPYNFAYLFKDTVLDKLFSANEKKVLSEKAAALKPRKIRIKTPIANTVSSFKSIPLGFLVRTTDPVYSMDSTYFFIDFTILEKTHKGQKVEEAYHSTVCVLYRKENGVWKKWRLRKHIIL